MYTELGYKPNMNMVTIYTGVEYTLIMNIVAIYTRVDCTIIMNIVTIYTENFAINYCFKKSHFLCKINEYFIIK